MSRESRFPHRLNRDATVDSTCKICFATVASVTNEAELANHEAAHVCNRPDLDKFMARSGHPVGLTRRTGTEALHNALTFTATLP